MAADSRELRQALSAFVTGVTVITTVDDKGARYGLTANSFSSVSLDPPLILWSQSRTAPSFDVFRDAEHFAVNILANDQIDISTRFATRSNDKFAGLDVKPGLGGVPLIDGCAAYLECRKQISYPGGDHAVFLGKVERFRYTSRKPLAFGGGKYMLVHPHDLGPFSLDLGVANIEHVKAVRIATSTLCDLCKQIDETLALAVWGNHGPTVIRWEESSHPPTENLRTGLVLPLLSSAAGLAYAAFLPRALTGPFIEAELAAATKTAVDEYPTTNNELERALAEVRQHGMSRVKGKVIPGTNAVGVNAFTAPVFDQNGLMILAITAIGRSDALDPAWEGEVPRALKATATSLSRRLGYKNP